MVGFGSKVTLGFSGLPPPPPKEEFSFTLLLFPPPAPELADAAAAAAASAALAEGGGALPLVSDVRTPTPAATSVSFRSTVTFVSFMMTMAEAGRRGNRGDARTARRKDLYIVVRGGQTQGSLAAPHSLTLCTSLAMELINRT